MAEYKKYAEMSELDLIRENIRLGKKFPYEEAERTLGYNVLMQITKVEPDFFSRDYAIIKLVPKKSQKQQFITELEPMVIFSTSEKALGTGSVVQIHERLSGLVKSDFNLTVSPPKKRNFSTDSYTLHTTGPWDNLAVSETCPSSLDGFGDPDIFYNNGSSAPPLGRLTPESLSKSLCKYDVHFAFVKGDADKPRKNVYLKKDWTIGF